MKIIKDNKGGNIQVDDEDYELLNRYNWNCTPLGYAQTPIFMHRIIMNAPKGMVVDHIDNNPRNNQKHNLRICTHQENTRHRAGNSKTHLKGVKPPDGKRNPNWTTVIGYQGRQYQVFGLPDEHTAALMYDFWATYLHGDFAHTNFKVISHN